METMLNSPDALKSLDDRRKYMEELRAHFNQNSSMKKTGVQSEEGLLLSVLRKVATMDKQFDPVQRAQCERWISEIQNPRMRGRRCVFCRVSGSLTERNYDVF